MIERKMQFTVTLDEGIDPDEVCEALNSAFNSALSTDGIMDRFGRVDVGPIEVEGTDVDRLCATCQKVDHDMCAANLACPCCCDSMEDR